MRVSVPALNWYKLGLYAALFLAWTGGVYGYATYQCQMDHAKQETKEAEAETEAVVEEVNARLPEVQVREVESARQRAEIARLKGELDNALRFQNRPEVCDLSDAEFNAFNGLLQQTGKN